jgi:membrane-associated protease RseP (regulator of RpoE activity)
MGGTLPRGRWAAIALGFWLAGAAVAWAQPEPKAPPGSASEVGKAESPAPAEGPPRAYLGAVVDDFRDRGRGVRIERVMPGGPAEKAGLRKGDLVTGLGGIRVRQMADFAAILEQVAPGSSLTFEVLRAENRLKIDVVFGSRSGKERERMQPPTLVLPAPDGAPAPPEAKPPRTPNPPPTATVRPIDDHARIEMLERRVEQLERRIEQLERAISRQHAQ